MGTSKRNNLLDNYKNPGPGAYELKDMRKGGFQFTKEKKLLDEKLSFKFTPGPGEYKVFPDKRSKAIKARISANQSQAYIATPLDATTTYN
jgi:hypothetical protein